MASNTRRPASAATGDPGDPSADYKVLEKIGQGSFGIIRKVEHKVTREVLARKEISYAAMSIREKEQLHAEIKVLERLQHTNIVRYVSRHHVKASNELHLYMEYCSSGDLGGYIKRLARSHKYAEEDFVWSVLGQLVGALYRCHAGQDAPSPGHESELNKPKAIQGLRRKDEDQIILHRDLKPENVFLTNGETVKLGDFGLSKLLSAHDFASTYVGTPFYMSPEICSSERYSGKSDVWSLGCIIYELCALEPPFNARSHLELIQKIRLGRIKPLPQQYSKELGQVVAHCLRVNPDDRPDTVQLLQVPGIKFARMRLEGELKYQQGAGDRDMVVEKLKRSEKENQALREEVARLKDAESHLKMEWHTRATLIINDKVEGEKNNLRGIFEREVEKRTEERLSAHLASLPASEGVSVSVRSSTPPPELKRRDEARTTASSPERTSDAEQLDTELTSLSLGDETSPLAQRTKPLPRKTGRTPFTRARTVAEYPGSPMDVSPMPSNNMRGLALSPRREARLNNGNSNQPLRRNIFAEASKLPSESSLKNVSNQDSADDLFADDMLSDADEPDSPTRPSSGLANVNGDPFKTFAAPAQPLGAIPKRKARPSLGRQQTMPIQSTNPPRPRSNLFTAAQQPQSSRPTALPTKTSANGDSTKENRPPSSSNANRPTSVPVMATSPKRTAPPPTKKELTPSRQAPKAPLNKTPLGNARRAGDLLRGAQRNAGLQGRTLVELSQPATTGQGGSPMKWERAVESGEVAEMPSPFLARKGRALA